MRVANYYHYEVNGGSTPKEELKHLAYRIDFRKLRQAISRAEAKR
jgi:hypothetical protein